MEVTANIFKRLYLPFHAKLYRIAFALVGNQEEAEDIVQEVYSRLWERRKELAAVRNPEAYAITLTNISVWIIFVLHGPVVRQPRWKKRKSSSLTHLRKRKRKRKTRYGRYGDGSINFP